MKGIQIFFDQCSEKEFQNIMNLLSQNGNIRMEMIEDDITEILTTLGIPTNLKGYCYVKTAIELCIKDRDMLNSITKSLYPEIARLHCANYVKVEHAIRHAIQKAWESDESRLRKSVFGNSLRFGVRPTNAAFIAAIADYIELNKNIG